MTYSSNQDPLSQFVVISNGVLDEARIADNERNVRITMLKQQARQIGATCITEGIHGLVAAARFAGEATLQLFEAAAAEGRK